MRQRIVDLGAKVMNATHRAVLVLSGGRVLRRAFGMPVVELTTIGRRSGQPRHTMLTSPVHDDERVVLVASFGGEPRHPAWYLNLRENPDVEIEFQGEHREMRSRTATADEKAELWPAIVDAYKGYAQYQKRTDRDIPVVILEARSES